MKEIYNGIEVLETAKIVKTKWGNVRYVKCRCHCGNLFTTLYSSVKYGSAKSCGCSRITRLTTHNKSKHPLYSIWQQMKYRCTHKSCSSYHNYGGRGITVCDEWTGSDGFMNFYNWSIENGYVRGLSIDRIDNDGPYAPWNCRWVGAKTQQNNKRNNAMITDLDGKLYTHAQFEEKYGLHQNWLSRKIRRNWSEAAILFAAHHPEYNIHRSYRNGRYLDSEGFDILIPSLEVQRREIGI